MFEPLSIVPVSFWVVICLLVAGGILAFGRRDDGTGLPMLAVLGTVAAWYVGDIFYNDYLGTYLSEFDPGIMSEAWWQVALFLTVFLVTAPLIHRRINRRWVGGRSGAMELFQHGVGFSQIQKQLNVLFKVCLVVWGGLLLVAVTVLKVQAIYYLFPFLGYKASPWSHGQIGSGFDCFAIVAVYLQLLSATIFGVVAALATASRLRRWALILVTIAWPYFIFDRTRNSMLAMVVPAILCWVFLRLRGGFFKKGLILLACFLVVNTWMKFVIANRSHMSITAAFMEKGLGLKDQKNVHNDGMNMYEELCWINTFIDKGTFTVKVGDNYFAELVNPIPRGLWPGKPLIGLDYAIARGHHVISSKGAVDTTIATGMIGQGVVNFGRLVGPMVAALLMSFWVAWLARMDLAVHKLGRLPLFSLGLILTFNLGRDITLITLYPFVFGALAVWWLDRRLPEVVGSALTPAQSATPACRARVRSGKFVRRPVSGGFVKRRTLPNLSAGD